MSKLGVGRAIALTTLLGIVGLLMSRPELGIGQTTPPVLSDKSPELVEAERLVQQAEQLYHTGNYRDAIPLLQRVLAIRKKVLGEQHLDVAVTLNDLATVYYSQGVYGEAEPLYRQALEMRQRLLGQAHPDVAASLDSLATLYGQLGRYSEAEPLYRQALEMRKSLVGQEHRDVAASLNNLAYLYMSQGKYKEAEPLFLRALDLRKRLLDEESDEVSMTLDHLATLYQLQGRYSEAEPLFLQALDIRKRLNHGLLATSINNLALLYQLQGRYSEAEQHYRQALELRRQSLGENHPAVAASLNNLAALYQSQGSYREAEPLYRQALELRKRAFGEGHPDVAVSQNNLAYLYQRQGRYKEAELLFRQTLELMKRSLGEAHPDVATILNNLGGVHEIQGLYTEAEPFYRQALELRRRALGDTHPDMAASLNNLAFVYENQERYKEAEPLYRQALELRIKLLGEKHPLVANTLNNLAGLYKSQGRYSEAEAFDHQALKIRRLLGDNHPDVANSLNNLAGLYLGQGDATRALDFQTQGLEVEENNLALNLSAGFERQKRDYIKTIYGTTNSTISLHLYSAPNNPNAARLALTTVLRRKGRILDVLTNSQQILRQRLDPESQTLLNKLSETKSQLASLVYNRPNKLSLEEYRNQIASLETQTKDLEDKLSRRSQEFRVQTQPVTLEAIQKLIPADTVLVELVRYQPVNLKASPNQRFDLPHYAAYVLTSQGEPQGIDLGQAKKIEETLELLRQSLQDSQTPRPQVKQSARNLDKILMQPVRKLLGNTRKIILSPDSALNLIPFEALVDENNRYLVENYSFTYLTSGRELLRLQNPSPSKQPPVLMADPYFDRPGEFAAGQPNTNNTNLNTYRSINLKQQDFSPLPETAKEAEAIGFLLGVKPLIGSQATESAVKLVNSPRILHIATHGFFESPSQTELESRTFEDNPLLLSGLIFAGFKQGQSAGEDGILTALETTALNLAGTKLVVLSACKTGLGNINAGEGIYSLRRALVIAGSESQVISLWKVADDATKELMVAYYQRLLANEGRSEALRQTQLDMLKGQNYQHPAYWAAFIPSGNWTAIGRGD